MTGHHWVECSWIPFRRHAWLTNGKWTGLRVLVPSHLDFPTQYGVVLSKGKASVHSALTRCLPHLKVNASCSRPSRKILICSKRPQDFEALTGWLTAASCLSWRSRQARPGSGRGAHPCEPSPVPANRNSTACAAASPVRSSELLGGQDHSSSHLLSTLGPCCRSHEDSQSNYKKEAA